MSQITVVAMLCHTVAALPQPVCHEEIVAKDDMPMAICQLSQPAIADWKEKSRFSSEQWDIIGFKCIPGDYVPRDAI